MPQMHIIPLNQGITPDEIGTRLAAGWTYLGQMNVRRDSGIIDPTQPLTAEGLVPAYVWIQLEPVVPSSVLATLLWQMHMSEQFSQHTLDHLARGVGAFQCVMLDPGQGLLLPCGGGNFKGYRRSGPLDYSIDKSRKEQPDCQVGNGDAEHIVHPGKFHPDKGDGNE